MAKIRVHELAKELGVPAKDVLAYLEESGNDVSSHMSSLDDETADTVRKRFGSSRQEIRDRTAEQELRTGKTGNNTDRKDMEKEFTEEVSAEKADKKEGSQAAEELQKKAEPKAQSESKTQTASTSQAETGKGAVSASGNEGGNHAARQEKTSEKGKTRSNAGSQADASRKKQDPNRKPQDGHSKKKTYAVYNPQNSRMGQDSRSGKKQKNRNGRQQKKDYSRNRQQESSHIIKPRADRERLSQSIHAEEIDRQAQREYEARKEAEQKAKEEKAAAAKAEKAAAEKQPEKTAAAKTVEGGTARTQATAGNGTKEERSGAARRTESGSTNRAQRERSGSGERYAKTEKTGDRNRQKNVQSGRNAGSDHQNNRNRRQDGSGYSKESGRRVDNNSRSRSGRDSGKPAQSNNYRGKDSRSKDSRDKRDSSRGRKSSYSGKKNYDRYEDSEERYVNLEKKSSHKKKNPQGQSERKKTDEIRTVTLPEVMTVRELSEILGVQASAIVKMLFMKGEMYTVNQEVDYEKAEEIALEYNCLAEPEKKVDVIAELLKEEEEDESKMQPRPPVVCVMGHVDHGKTSLLDAIRSTRVTATEEGGITQHIGASVVEVGGRKITFLDTPGHEAFTAMRMRGANSTDIAVLVVAADDGVMPQTVEAINHAKAAGIEIIVAINKIDKPGANVERVKQELTEYGLVAEDWGGSTVCVPVSAKTKEGIDQLLEMILLTGDILELKANPNRKARGLVIEAKIDKGRGPVATVLVQKGTLRVGDPVAAGSSHGKIRALLDDRGNRVKEAGPSMPVEILGLDSAPNAGEVFVACDSEKDAREFAETFVSRNKEKLLEETRHRMSLDDLFNQIQAGKVKELNLIVKADVQGSVEAVKQSLLKLSNDEVVVKVIHAGVGAIKESDVVLASASNAIIIGFDVKPDSIAKSVAEQEGVDIRLYSIIYNAIDDVEAAMKGMLEPIYEEKVTGHAEIRQLFKASGVGMIAGSYVLDGVIERGSKIRITRDGEQIYEGSLASLKHFKDDVKQMKAGFECGLVFEGFNDFKEQDIVEAYKMVEVPRT